MKSRLHTKYSEKIVPELMKKFKLKNPFQVPKLEKIVINMGIGEGIQDIKVLEKARSELALITGQQPVITRAKKDISNFKIRKGDPVGCKVTLRKERMYEFLDRLVNVALPRIRDFRGVNPNSFDENGNYSLGIDEQSIFPEIDVDKITRQQGMDISIVVNVRSKEIVRELLRMIGMPFRRSN